MKHLQQAKDYVENAEKTLVDNGQNHFDNLFPYIANNDKTLSMQLVSGHMITDVKNAVNEFIYTKQMAAIKQGTHINLNAKTGELELDPKDIEKGNGKGEAVLAHHLIQSFSPEDKLSPEEIHRIGRETMMEFTGGEYEFVIATHIDKAHIHNHIIMNSTNALTGKAFKWKVARTKNGKHKDYTKEMFEKISDKHASKAGAIIIDKSPKNSHKKYTMWQTENIYKSKIKSRLDFLLEHSTGIEDFKEKAAALHLSIDFSKKWATYRLLDEPQIKNTRGRNLQKGDPEKYNLDRIQKRLLENEINFSIDDVVDRYEEKEQSSKNDFDYLMKIESWQIDHVTSKGIYLTIDFGLAERGQLFIGGYKVDKLENGDYNLYLKRNDWFYFMNQKSSERNRYMSGETLMKQLKLYNGSVPIRKEPVIAELDDIIAAINFLAEYGVNDGKQMFQLERKLERSLKEAEAKLQELDEKIIELNQASKSLMSESAQGGELAEVSSKNINDIAEELQAAKLGKKILQETFDEIIDDLENYHEIKVGFEKEIEEENNYRL